MVLVFLFIVIPLVEGWLFALLLREVHVRHRLPLGGAIASLRPPPKPVAVSAKIQEAVNESVEQTEPTDVTGERNGDVEEVKEVLGKTRLPEQVPVDKPAAVSVFDGAGNVPGNLPVNDVLGAMTAEITAIIPNTLERRIEEEAARPGAEIPPEVHDISDEINQDDLLALAEALPGNKIDFTQELEADHENPGAISPMAKELLGENFDFDALEKQSRKVRTPESPPGVDEGSADQDATNADLVAAAIDVQADALGNVQASSPLMFNVTPQLAVFSVPQTIVSSFSGDWVQEMDGSVEPIEGDTSKFCFSEESRPMFVRKRKSN